MTDNVREPSPRHGASVLPPLSKFYYGPARGWASAEASPSHNGSIWSSNSPPEIPPSLPPRLSPGPPAYSPSAWQNQFPQTNEESQGWSSGPTQSTLQANEVPDSYASTSGRSYSPVNPGWDSGPSSSSVDLSSWGVAYKRKQSENPDLEPRPPLPSRPPRLTGQTAHQEDQAWNQRSPHSKYSSQQPSARASATTIDVPLYLQPHTFDAEPAPPLPKRSSSPPQGPSSPIRSPPQPQRLPPPPPKIPLDVEVELQNNRPAPQPPEYDSQNSFGGGNCGQRSQGSLGSTRSLKRPRSDLQNSLEDRSSHGQWQTQVRRPPPQHQDAKSLHGSNEQQPLENSQYHHDDGVRHHQATAQLHQASVSTVNEDDHYISNTSRWDSQMAYVPSPEQQHAVIAPQDGRSTSATEASSNRPAVSPPVSQQTSDTSHRESGAQVQQGRHEQENNDSFYWHSGRSSSDCEEEKSNATTTVSPRVARHVTQTAVQYEAQGLPVRSTSLSPTPAVSYGASALGFGGPSDWEYFGDYEAEEVDDEDLYTRKVRAELPADYARSINVTPPRAPEPPRSKPNAQNQPLVPGRPTARQLQESQSEEQYHQRTEVRAEDGSILESKWSPSTATPTTPGTSFSRPLTTTEPMPPEDQRPDLDEVIRAWSDAPRVGQSLEARNSLYLTEREDGHRDNAAEASLASTPGEHILGVHAALKHAPSIPKLPDAIDPCRPMQARPVSDAGPLDLNGEHGNGSTFRAPQQLQDHPTDLGVPNLPKAETDSPSVEPAEQPSDRLSVASDRKWTKREETDQAAMKSTQQPSDHLRVTPDTAITAEVTDALSPIELVQQPSNSPTVCVDVTRSRKDKADSLSPEFERERRMLESPSDKKSTSPAFPRQPFHGSKSQTGSAAPTTSGLGIVLPLAASTAEFQGTSLQEPHQILSGEVQHDSIIRAGSPENSQSSLEVHPIGKLRHSTNNSQQEMLTNLAPTPPEKIMPADSQRLTRSQSATKAQMTVQEASKPLSRTTSVNSLLPASEASKRGETCTSSEVKILSEQLKPTHTPAEGTQHSSAQSIPDAVHGSAQVQDFESQAQPEFVAEKAHKHPKDDMRQNEAQQPLTETMTEWEDPTSKAKDSVSQYAASKSISEAIPEAIPEAKPLYENRKPKLDLSDDPYADLDPWGRASLNRFAAMLREEARAESNQDKLNIFSVFSTRESRLRVILYGTDDELILSQKPNDITATGAKRAPSQKQHTGSLVEKPRSRTNTTNLERSAKALPPLPPNRDSVIGSPTSKLTPLVTDNSVGQVNPRALQGPPSETSQSMVKLGSDSPQYSPGGRPIVAHSDRTSKLIEGHQAGNSKVPEPDISVRKDGSILGTASPSIDAPVPLDFEVSVEEQKAAQATARSNDEARSEVKNYLTNRRSVYRPFATQTMESMENATYFGREPDYSIEEPSISGFPAPTSLYNSAAPLRDNATITAKGVTKISKEGSLVQQPNLRRFVDADFDPLVTVLPESASINESVRLVDLKKVLEAIPEDFSFIHGSVVAWDAKVKEQRAENERQRHARQVESEQRIDSLFDEHEIGYGDIAELESEFKRSEAARKTEEDRAEYRTFVEDVFNLVWTCLHYEIEQLAPKYEEYSRMMNDTLAGKDMFEALGDGLALAPTMNTFLALHQKLEIRHQKAFEAVLERDRRLKQTEISPWYTLSNIAKVKQLEKQFEDAEKKAIIEYCQQRDERANRLMDVLDQNTLRGVGANQDYMEAIMKAVRRIASGRAFASIPASDEPKQGIELVQKAKNITALLATSSEQIVQTFHVADMLLNSADYEVSVAKAKVSKADMATLAKLKEERAKEDQKLMRDLEHRLALIREDSRRTNDEIVKLMLFLGVQNGRAMDAQAAPPALGVQQAEQEATPGMKDPEHEARMQRALDEAKKRNAAKDRG
ncbi:MAG: hypothetical protein Q9217_000310 [Psora testacea]